MKEIHKKLLELANTTDLSTFTYRKIGEMLGGEHPYQVQYSIQQLLKTSQLLKNKRTGSIYLGGSSPIAGSQVVNIPIYGNVSCGIPVDLAGDEMHGFLSVSPSIINSRPIDKLFALKANGDSMNMANIGGKAVYDGDFVVVRHTEWVEAKNGDYVVLLIGECANLKKIQIDKNNRRIILLSETTENYSPIIVAEEDIQDYEILGLATDVIKAIPAQ